MKIFISWSKDTSHKVAESFRELLPHMFKNLELFISSEDIEKGERWEKKVFEKLRDTDYGIVCLTEEGINSPWLNFEAGALAKNSNSRLYTLFFGVTLQDIKSSPLTHFQSTDYREDDVKKMIKWINKNYDQPLSDDVFNQKFEDFWKNFTEKLNPIYESIKKKAVFVLEEEELDVMEEIKTLKSTLLNLRVEKCSIKEIATISDSPNLIIYVYSQSSQSQENLKKIITYVQNQKQSPSLIIYTLDNKKLKNDEFTMAKPYKIANFSDTLMERCKDVFNKN